MMTIMNLYDSRRVSLTSYNEPLECQFRQAIAIPLAHLEKRVQCRMVLALVA